MGNFLWLAIITICPIEFYDCDKDKFIYHISPPFESMEQCQPQLDMLEKLVINDGGKNYLCVRKDVWDQTHASDNPKDTNQHF